jgi:outer membrane receptor protein involved in Fe transport
MLPTSQSLRSVGAIALVVLGYLVSEASPAQSESPSTPSEPADAQRAAPAQSESSEAAPAADIAASTQDEPINLEEVVVTARKRTESLQRVPISAVVVNGAALADQGIATIQDLTGTLPAVKLSKGSTTNRQFIRGIGSGDNPSFEQSVGTFIDDIYHGRARSSEASLFDLERVEVLKGPQTTYFGNNAIAGALNIITRDPGTDFSLDSRLSYTPEFHAYTAGAAVDFPALETLVVRLAGQVSGGDGWIEDIGAGEDIPHTRNHALRGTLLWKPTDDFTARLKGQYVKEDQRGGLPIVRAGCPPSPEFGAPTGFCAAAIASEAGPSSADFTRNTSPGQFTRLDSDDYVATLSLDRPSFVLTSITGYSAYDYALGTDLDLTPLTLLTAGAPEDYRQVSQELRITSDNSHALEYVAGLYFQRSTLNGRNTFTYSFLSPSIAASDTYKPLVPYLPFAAQSRFREENDTASAFGALTWKVLDTLRLTGGLRYSIVDKDFLQTITVGTGSADFGPLTPFPSDVADLGASFAQTRALATVGATPLSRRDKHFSPSLSLQYDVSARVMLYGRFDHGFKAGGFNGVDLNGSAATLPFSEETVDAFEVGVKSKLLDNRATLNVAAFRSKYKDLQLAGVVPSSTGAYVNRVQNAGGAISQGIEVEASLAVTSQLRTTLSGTYLDSYYSSYPNATPTALQTLQLNQCVAANPPPSTACDSLRAQDLSEAETPFAPKFSGSWTVGYSLDLGSSLTLSVENRLFASSDYLLNFNNDPNVRQDSYVREDLTLTLASQSGWEASLIGQNLTDEVIRTYGAALPASLGSYAFITELPRSIAVQLKYSF